ncbi:MAG: hypothetical protein AAF384_01870 [Pseudomonadota bacterium]
MARFGWCLAIALLGACDRGPFPARLGQELPPPDEKTHLSFFENLVIEPPASQHIHGCVHARVEIRDDLEPRLQVGLFSTPRTYPAWIRFAGERGADQPALRSMAIKLWEFEGVRLHDPDEEYGSFDIMLFSHSVSPHKDAKTLADAIAAQQAGKALWFYLNPFAFKGREYLIERDMRKTHTDLFEIDWNSALPYKLGNGRAVKYLAESCAPPPDYIFNSAPNLETILHKRLLNEDVCFDLSVQIQTDPIQMPIEDPRVAWEPADSTPIPVARIIVPTQEYDSEDQMNFCRNIGFNPWRATAAHQPLGGINRAYRAWYERFNQAQRANGKQRQYEPISFNIYF